MAKKFYAVQKGIKPGIYMSWEDTKPQVEGVSNAVYKSFNTLEEAAAFLEGDGYIEVPEPVVKPEVSKTIISPDTAYAFVDGSFNVDTKVYGYGGFLRLPELQGRREELILQGNGSISEMVSMRNVAGEIEGACAAISTAWKHNCTKLLILYDYKGIEEWANGTWRANKRGTIQYQEYVKLMRSKGMEISFQHVKAHTGIEGNERADTLAKQAVGILPMDDSEPLSIDEIIELLLKQRDCFQYNYNHPVNKAYNAAVCSLKSWERFIKDLEEDPNIESKTIAEQYFRKIQDCCK